MIQIQNFSICVTNTASPLCVWYANFHVQSRDGATHLY